VRHPLRQSLSAFVLQTARLDCDTPYFSVFSTNSRAIVELGPTFVCPDIAAASDRRAALRLGYGETFCIEESVMSIRTQFPLETIMIRSIGFAVVALVAVVFVSNAEARLFGSNGGYGSNGGGGSHGSHGGWFKHGSNGGHGSHGGFFKRLHGSNGSHGSNGGYGSNGGNGSNGGHGSNGGSYSTESAPTEEAPKAEEKSST
jgi:hypothetical protein